MPLRTRDIPPQRPKQSALCFVGLAANSIFLFADAVLFPDVNLVPLRHLSSLAAIAVLLYGFVWEAE